MNLSDWCYVCVNHPGSRHTYQHVRKSDLMLLVKATVRLHVTPGYNPHNMGKTTPVSGIFAYEMDKMMEGHYWWSGPGLGVQGQDERQARVLSPCFIYKQWNFYPALRKRGIDPIKR